MAAVFLFYPVYAAEQIHYSSWDDGYLKASVIMPTTTADYAIGSYGGSCVTFIRTALGIPYIIPINTPYWVWNADLLSFKKLEKPQKGAILITSEGNVGHMALIENVDLYGIIKVVESNFLHNTIGERTFNIDDDRIIGYLKYIP